MKSNRYDAHTHCLAFILVSFCVAASAEDATKATDRAKTQKPNEIPLAIDGYCAVSIVEPGVGTKGEEKFQIIYEGLRYLFLSEEEKLMLEASPEKYAIAYNGLDLVATYDKWCLQERRVRRFSGVESSLGDMMNAPTCSGSSGDPQDPSPRPTDFVSSPESKSDFCVLTRTSSK